jgi:hypothetical protein
VVGRASISLSNGFRSGSTAFEVQRAGQRRRSPAFPERRGRLRSRTGATADAQHNTDGG